MNEGVSAAGQLSSNKLTSISLPSSSVGGGDSSHNSQGTPMSRLPIVSAAADRLPPHQPTTVFRTQTQPTAQSPILQRASSSSYVDGSSQNINSQSAESPDRKRIKLEVTETGSGSNGSTTGNDDLAALKRRILEHKYMRLRSVKEKYSEHVSELFFLQQGGNMMEHPAWRKKPQSPQFITFSRQHRLDQSQLDEIAVRNFFYYRKSFPSHDDYHLDVTCQLPILGN